MNGFLTIGHGRKGISEFNELLLQYGVTCLVDVRSVPFSRFNPQYNQKALDKSLTALGIKYLFLGDHLGGRPNDEDSYDDKGKVDYRKLRERPFFRSGIEQLLELPFKAQPTVLMCSETDPAECHRCRLIGEVLEAGKISVMHIDKDGTLKTHETIMSRVAGKNQPRLF